MPEINICDSAGRDALVAIESVRSQLKVRWVDQQGRQAAGRFGFQITSFHSFYISLS